MPDRRARHSFDVPVNDVVLRVAADEALYEEVRAAGMSFFERIQAYGARNPAFARSKGPIELPEDAPEIAREMAAGAALAGVGPMYTFRGALVEFVGRGLAERQREVSVATGGVWFAISRKRVKLSVRAHAHGGEDLSVVVKPELGAHGIYSSLGRETEPGWGDEDGLVVVAGSAIAALGAATAAKAILAKRDSLADALAYLQGLPVVHGAMLVRGDHIGLAGGLELAA